MRRDAPGNSLTALPSRRSGTRTVAGHSRCKDRELVQIAIGRYLAKNQHCLHADRRRGNHKSDLDESFKGRLSRAYCDADRGAVSAPSSALSPHQVCQFCHQAARSSISANRCGATFRALSQRRVCLFQPWCYLRLGAPQNRRKPTAGYCPLGQ
jgi:hypothetical protein